VKLSWQRKLDLSANAPTNWLQSTCRLITQLHATYTNVQNDFAKPKYKHQSVLDLSAIWI